MEAVNKVQSAAANAVSLEILGNRLLSVAEEMGATLIKTAYSTNIKERRDCSTAVFDARGQMIAQAEHIPMHLGSLLGAVTSLLQKFSVETLKPGDTFVTNDPYSGGGTHLPDITLVSPVFWDETLVGFVACLAHHADVGGKVPGSTSGDANSIFQEGLRIPLTRVCNAGELVQDVVDFVLLNSRTPTEREGDLAAQIAANRVGEKRLQDVVKNYGVERYFSITAALMDYAEKLMSAGIRSLPDGVYSFVDYMDDDGINIGEHLPIAVNITIQGETAHVDFAGSNPQVNGPINVPLNGTLATVFYCFKALVGANIPSNQGIYRVLNVTAPEGSIVNCQPPAPVGERIDTCQRVADVIFGAMAEAVPNRVITASNSSVTTATFSGTNAKTGDFFVYLETIAGGQGAHANGDGLSGVQVHMTNTSNLPAEALEREYPLLVKRYTLRQNSGGAGCYRGGLGIQRDILALQDGITFSSLADRQQLPPWGLNGGKDGAAGQYLLVRKNGEVKKLGAKDSGVRLDAGDIISVQTPGSGGFGNSYKRDAAHVRQDVVDGKINREAAMDLYGVIIDEQHVVDEKATQLVRSAWNKPELL